MEVVIRKGTEADIAPALALVRELAEFEKQPQEVSVTTEEMRNWGFGAGKVFDFFVAEKAGRIIGTAIYYFKYSTWKGKCLFLEDIIVTGPERCNGYGSLLFAEVVKVAKESRVRRLEWQVLDWNTDAIRFYKRWGASFDAEWLNVKLTGEQLSVIEPTS
jgi:GNAT superfamily N-acetyltransferase